MGLRERGLSGHAELELVSRGKGVWYVSGWKGTIFYMLHQEGPAVESGTNPGPCLINNLNRAPLFFPLESYPLPSLASCLLFLRSQGHGMMLLRAGGNKRLSGMEELSKRSVIDCSWEGSDE